MYYETFKDLKFDDPEVPGSGKQAKMFFPNGYGISVITGLFAYSNTAYEYEVAVLKGNKDACVLTYQTPITDNVIGHLLAQDVTDVMRQIQDLPEVQS